MEALLQDVRYALRSLRKRPLFAAVAILTLGLGIGGTAAIFSVVNAALLRPLPFPEPDRLVKVSLTRENESDIVWSYPKFEVLRAEQRIFSRIAGYFDWSGALAGAGDPERLQGERVTADYFDLLGVTPSAGRGFTEEEARDPGRADVALIGETLWRTRFNADPAAVGRVVQLDGKPVTIVGVIPADFRGLSGNADIFVPMATVGRMMRGEFAHFMTVVARLGPGITLERARSDVAVLGGRINEVYRSPRDADVWSAGVKPLEELRIDPAIRRSVLVLFGAVTGVLLISCVNVANLLLARAAGRRREIAVRLAIGAARARLIRQLMTEAMVLALVGGAFGILIAAGGMRALAGIAAKAGSVLGRQAAGFNAVSLAGVELDLTVLMFALAASVVTGVLFGIAPALQASRAELTSDLKEGGTATLGSLGVRGLTGRNVLVVGEIAVAFMLLIGSGLMLRSLSRLLHTDAGVDPNNLLTMQISLPDSHAPDAARAFWQQLLSRVDALPGVRSAAVADCPPLIGRCRVVPFWPAGNAAGSPPAPVGMHYVTSNYLAALRLPLKQGRTFDVRDRAGSPSVILINETAAQKFFPGENPVSKRVAVAGGFADGAEIIGVIGDQRFQSIEAPPEPDVYIAYDQVPQRSGYVFVRTAGDPSALAATLRREVQALDPNLPVHDVQTMEQRVGGASARTRVTGMLLALFAGVALLLALVGIYAVVSYAVTQRTRELGVRIALGAARSDVAALVLRHSGLLVGLGIGLGLIGALATTRVLRALLYEVQPTDPVVFASLTFVTVIVALAASAAPAVRATRVDPLTALKSE
jgi:putative ABC transport system permease protein